MWQQRAAERYRIGLDLADLELRDALADALAAEPGLTAAAPGERADAVVTDRAAGAASAPALRIGAGGMPAEAGAELILAAARLVAAGFRVEPAEPVPAADGHRLSPREREVLGLIVEGAPNKAIARALGIAVRTAKFHVAAILAKLGAHNRAEAVAIALREGLIVF